jgi:hypothetical protein
VLEKISELVNAGATVIGPKPARAETLEKATDADAAVQKIADELWDGKNLSGRVITGKTAREVLLSDGVPPDFAAERRAPARLDENSSQQRAKPVPGAPLNLDYIHRTDGGAEIYFVANRATNFVSANCLFRVSGQAPELWNAVTGERKFAAAYEEKAGRTMVPLDFAPCGSWFVIFREPSLAHPATAKSNSQTFSPLAEISGAWTVHFDPKWGGPETAQFDSLVSWPTRPEPGIKFYSGTATYEKTFEISQSAIGNRQSKIYLDLGGVRELAEVKVNGQSCGIVWCPPWRVDVTQAMKSGENKLQIEVVNFWPNRIIGDASLPEAQRLTRTNIRKLTAKTPLEPAGLFGPVRLLTDGGAK